MMTDVMVSFCEKHKEKTQTKTTLCSVLHSEYLVFAENINDSHWTKEAMLFHEKVKVTQSLTK